MILITALTLASCDHKDLWVIDETGIDGYKVKLDYLLEWHRPYTATASDSTWLGWIDNWPDDIAYNPDSLEPSRPRYCRMIVENGTRQKMTIFDGDSGVASSLTAGMQMLFYNVDTEYIVYSHKDNLSTLTASTNVSDGILTAVVDTIDSLQNEAVYKQPDVVFSSDIVRFSDSIMVDNTIHVVLHPLVWSYVVDVRIGENLSNVSRAYGYMTRLAKSVKVAEHATNDDTMTVGFAMDINSTGVSAIVKSFGIPRYNPHSPTLPPAPGCRLIVILTLDNGKKVVQEWNIDNQILAQPAGGLIAPGQMTIPKEALEGGSAGFDVNVEGWGKEHNLDLKL